MELDSLTRTFLENYQRRLEELSSATGETFALILGREGLDKTIACSLRSGRRKDPRVSTIVRLARAVGVGSAEEFGLMFTREPRGNSPGNDGELSVEKVVTTFLCNFQTAIEAQSKETGETFRKILGRQGLNSGTAWTIRTGIIKDPRLSTLIRLAKAVRRIAPEEFGRMFSE